MIKIQGNLQESRRFVLGKPPMVKDCNCISDHTWLPTHQEVSTVRSEATTVPPSNRNPGKPQQTYENYDTKYNVYDSEPEPKPDNGGNGGSGGGGRNYRFSSASAQGTILVIGIIAGALIAIVLIVVIVSDSFHRLFTVI